MEYLDRIFTFGLLGMVYGFMVYILGRAHFTIVMFMLALFNILMLWLFYKLLRDVTMDIIVFCALSFMFGFFLLGYLYSLFL